MMRVFGPVGHPDLEQVATPAGMTCLFCEEPIAHGDSGFVCEDAILHRECQLRTFIGSVAHVQKRCSCFVPGAEETDPPELTRRQAARLAVELWQAENGL
jgi:hypothetical protein